MTFDTSTSSDLIGDIDLIGNVGGVAFDADDDEVEIPTRGDFVNGQRKYSPQLFARILKHIKRGKPLRVALGAEGIKTAKTFYTWLERYDLKAKYEAVKDKAAHIDDDVANEIIYRIGAGETFKQIVESNPNLPDRLRFKEWLKTHPQYHERYHAALAIRAEGSIDEAEAIADEAENDWTTDKHGNPVVNSEAIARSKLRIEIRKWVAGKYNSRFQDRNTTELVGANNTPLIPPQQDNAKDIAVRVAFLLSAGLAAKE